MNLWRSLAVIVLTVFGALGAPDASAWNGRASDFDLLEMNADVEIFAKALKDLGSTLRLDAERPRQLAGTSDDSPDLAALIDEQVPQFISVLETR